MLFWYIGSLLSAVIFYTLPFYIPTYCWWTIFLFPVPLFVYSALRIASFTYGYLFGFLSLLLHLQGVFSAVFLMGQGAWLYKIAPFMFNTLYHACFAGLFFWLGYQCIRLLKAEQNYFLKIIVSWLALYAFIMYMDLFCLLPFDRCEGYFLMNPLVPLAQHPLLLLRTIPYVGKACTTFLLLGPAALCSILYVYFKKLTVAWTVIFATALCLLVNYEDHFNVAIPTPSWHKEIVAMPIAFVPQYNLTFLASSVADVIKHYLASHPNVNLFVMPESSFYCAQLAMPALSNVWGQQTVGKKIHVLAGAFRWKGDHYFNSMHWVYDGELQKCFDKRHAMVLTERLPTLLQNSFWQNIFFAKQPQITPSKKEKKLIKIDDNWSLVPYICSELFFNYYPDDGYPVYPIVAICNDRLLAPYVTNLMFLGAICQAIAWQRTIVYVSFLYQLLILPNGKTVPLARIAS